MQGKFFDKFCFNTIILFVAVLVLGGLQLSSVFKAGEGGKMTGPNPVLPKTVGLWTRPDSPRVVTAENIFDYMNGAGELYLGYRFDRLDVYVYKAETQKEILVELYFMKSSDDAFGLLSLDWGGETVGHDSDWPRALYGDGLLRLWSENIYARVMATQETPESREAVLSIGQAIIKGRKNLPGPNLMKKLKNEFSPDWGLRQDRASFFRTHLVLNSLFYLSHQNILDLDVACEAVRAEYERRTQSGGRTRITFLWVNYPDPERAQTALSKFHQAYLPEHDFAVKSGSFEKVQNIYAVEDGWMAYVFQDKSIAFVFECPDQETTRAILDQIK
ncbi:MAG: hypothetical protein JSV17_00285 [Candidatus Aminicenantes bacterium]|nr:MAG: hypothetical protein JSV17_00285 [Candidatus Aminicenantes bacterium]